MNQEVLPPDPDALADVDLVRRCQAADAAAWSVLVQRYQRLVYTIPRRAGLADAAASDVFQVTFTRLWQHIDTVQDGARVRAWLVTTARRETLRELKRAGRHEAVTVSIDAFTEPVDDEGGSGDDGDARAAGAFEVAAPSGELSEEERWLAVQHAFERLEPRCRQLLELLFLADPEPSYAQIGERLGMPIGSIGPTRSRCLGRLRKAIGEG